MTAPRIGSLLIGTDQLETMKSWYRRAFSPKENEMGAFEFGDFQLFIEEHSEVSGPNVDGARFIINLDVTDCRGLGKHLRDLDSKFIRAVEQEPFGLIATVTDPDGNYVQIIEWGASPESHKDS